MPHHSADFLNERLKGVVFYYQQKKNQQKKINSFHRTHFPYKKWNGFGQNFSTYWFMNKGETKEEKGETLTQVSKTRKT